MSTHGTYVPGEPWPALRFERRIAHPVDIVWRAVSEPAELAHWFPTAVDGLMRPGGELRFTFPGDDEPAHTGRVLQVEAPARLAFTWFGDVLRFELEPLDAGAATLLRFTHELREVDAAARTMAGWTVCLDVLERRTAGEPATAPGPRPTAEWQEHYDHYVAAGVPAGAPVPPPAS